MGCSRQEYWNGLLFPSPGNLPDPGIKPRSPVLQAVSCIAGRFFTNKLPGKPQLSIISPKFIPALESQREEEEDEYSSSEAQVPLVSWFGGPGWMGMLELPPELPLFYDSVYQDLTLTPSSVRLL